MSGVLDSCVCGVVRSVLPFESRKLVAQMNAVSPKNAESAVDAVAFYNQGIWKIRNIKSFA
jgi:hypothetical protein